jgi:hypothetical protein
MPATKRTFTCPLHGEVEEHPSQRGENGFFTGFHCCVSVGHRCGWDTTADDRSGCHRALLPAPLEPGEKERREAIANDPAAARKAAREMASQKRITVQGNDSDHASTGLLPHELAAIAAHDGISIEEAATLVEQVEGMGDLLADTAIVSDGEGGVILSRAVLPRPRPQAAVTRYPVRPTGAGSMLTDLLNDVDDAILHVTSGEAAICSECMPGGSCAVARLIAVLDSGRSDGILPANTRRPRLLATFTENTAPDFIEAMSDGMRSQYPELWLANGVDGLLEVWSKQP